MPTTFETVDFGIAFLGMLLTYAAVDTLSPKIEAASFKLPTHNAYDFRLRNAKLHLDGFKRGAVFPCHFDDAVEVS